MPTEPILELSHVSYRFPRGSRASGGFHDISLSIAKGEFVSLIGPSGAGKSTLLRTIAGLITDYEGELVRRASRTTMVFQGYGLFPWLTALDNAAFGLSMQGVASHLRNTIAKQKLDEVGLRGFEHRFMHELSGGQRQRVAMARALAVSPDLLLTDEPFSSLDSITASALKEDIIRIWKKYRMTILMVNHLIPDAVELSDRVVVMGGSPGEITEAISITSERPRDMRSDAHYALVDRLTKLIS